MMLMKRRSVLAGGAAMAALAFTRPSFAAGTGNIFVSTEKGNEVVVLDKAYNIIKRIATSKRPRDMQMTKAHDLLYVACGDDDSIDVIDVGTLEVVDSIPTGPSPEMFRLSDDETSVYVSDEENSTVERIDLKSKIAVQTIPSGAEPEGILIMPGGAYTKVVLDKEGNEVAEWLTGEGYVTGVLKYRLPGDGWAAGLDAPGQDALRAMRLLRQEANKQTGLNKIGVMGFSAGGHLAAVAGTRYADPLYDKVDAADALSARPDFMALLYPALGMRALPGR